MKSSDLIKKCELNRPDGGNAYHIVGLNVLGAMCLSRYLTFTDSNQTDVDGFSPERKSPKHMSSGMNSRSRFWVFRLINEPRASNIGL